MTIAAAEYWNSRESESRSVRSLVLAGAPRASLARGGIAHLLVLLVLGLVMLGLPQVTFAQSAPPTPSVMTDQADYAPGSSAQIMGGGFQPGENIILQVLHADGTPSIGDDHLPWTVVAGDYGNFTSSWFVCMDDCLGSTLQLTAVGETSGFTATSTFLDGGPGPTSCSSVFQAVPAYSVGNSPRSVAVGDFNGDGKADLAVANSGSASVSVLLSNGTGSFFAAVNYAVGTSPTAVAVGDFNGDGKADLAVANQTSNNVSVLLNNGSGAFVAAVNYSVGTAPSSVAVGDFNGDGKTDLAVANQISGTVSVRLNNGSGSFPTIANFLAGATPRSVAVGDFNGDGKADLAVASFGSSAVQVLLNNGSGGFPTRVGYFTGSPVSVAVGEFNGDGKVDLVVANQSTNNVSILLNDGIGGFLTATSYGAGTTPRSVAVGDFNRDGKTDLAVANSGSNNVSVLLNNGTGSFLPAANYGTGNLPVSVAVGDFDGDGGDDLAVANQFSNNVSVLASNPDGTFQVTAQYNVSLAAGQVAVGKFNGDATADLALATFSADLAVLLSASNGTFPATAHYTVADGGSNVAVGDFNSDQQADLVMMTSVFPQYVTVLPGNGDGTFQAPVSYLFGHQGAIGAVADFNGDHKDDLALLFQGNLIEVWLGNGDGTFQAGLDYDLGFGLSAVGAAVGDFNGDQIADLAVTIGNTDQVAVLLGNGQGSFNAAPYRHLPAGVSSPRGVAVGDFNGDGKDDLAVANGIGNALSVLLGDGNGGFPSGVNYPVGSGSLSVAVGDFDGDGNDDVAVTNFNSNSVSVLNGIGNGTFQTAVNYNVPMAWFVSAGDFNADGKPDLAVSQNNLGSISILLSHVCNAPPVARCTDVTVSAGSTCSASASIDNGSSDPDAGDTITLAQTPAGPYPLGTTTVTLTVTDHSAASSQCQGTVTVVDSTPPAITCPGPITATADPGVCGASAGFAASTSDNCGASIAYDIAGAPVTSPHTFSVGTTTVHAVATDGAGHNVGCTFDVTVLNPNPMVTLTGPPSGSLYAVNSPVNFTATFVDAGGGTHTGTWMFDAISQGATITEPAGATPGSATATYLFGTAGVYRVALTINDSCGGSGTADQMSGMEVLIVIYDPSAGFVTGGGWIDSPPGAYVANPALSGKANFGFVSKYNKGATAPTGETEFQFKVADFNFHSSVYQWLVVSGALAQYKGTGTINGAGTYNFLLTATDGQLSGGGGSDKFRIKITDAGGAVVYDNVLGASDDINTANPQIIGGGSIVIHK